MSKVKSFVVFFAVAGIAIFGLVYPNQSQPRGDKDINKIVLSYEKRDDFKIEPYIECLYKINKDKSNKCLEGEIERFIEEGSASDALELVRVISENKEYIIANCEYLSERIGKVFYGSVSLDSLFSTDFEHCDYGFQIGAIGKVGKGFLNDKNILEVIKERCNSYNKEGLLKSKESEVCYKILANILTSSASDLSPLESRDLCLLIGDPEGVCLSNLLVNYISFNSKQLSKSSFTNKESIVETLLNFCKGVGRDNTAECLPYSIANILSHNEKLIYLVANYCDKVSMNLTKRCYREIANGFNLSVESKYSIDNKRSDSNELDLDKSLKIFTENQLNYCNFLGEVVGVDKELERECLIGYTLVLLNYYKIDESKACDYFNNNEVRFCREGINIAKGRENDDI